MWEEKISVKCVSISTVCYDIKIDKEPGDGTGKLHNLNEGSKYPKKRQILISKWENNAC